MNREIIRGSNKYIDKSVFTWEKYLHHGIDEFFNARLDDVSGLTSSAVNASTYWKQDMKEPYFNGEVIVPRRKSLAIYSKGTYSMATFRAIINDELDSIWLGFENGSNLGTGIAAFHFRDDRVYLSASGAFGWNFIDITNLMPSDIYYAFHIYTVYIEKNSAWFYVDNNLVGISINGWKPHFGYIDGPPYVIFRTYLPFPSKATALIEFSNSNNYDVSMTLPIYNVRLAQTPEIIPKIIRFNKANSGQFITSTWNNTVSSHPVPIIGYNSRTLILNTSNNSSGRISIEVMTQNNNWIRYRSYKITNRHKIIAPILANATLLRITVKPDRGKTITIYDAEIDLS